MDCLKDFYSLHPVLDAFFIALQLTNISIILGQL